MPLCVMKEDEIWPMNSIILVRGISESETNLEETDSNTFPFLYSTKDKVPCSTKMQEKKHVPPPRCLVRFALFKTSPSAAAAASKSNVKAWGKIAASNCVYVCGVVLGPFHPDAGVSSSHYRRRKHTHFLYYDDRPLSLTTRPPRGYLIPTIRSIQHESRSSLLQFA